MRIPGKFVERESQKKMKLKLPGCLEVGGCTLGESHATVEVGERRRKSIMKFYTTPESLSGGWCYTQSLEFGRRSRAPPEGVGRQEPRVKSRVASSENFVAEGRRERQQTKTGSAAGLTGLNWLRRERGKPKPVYSSKKYLRYRHSIHAPPPPPPLISLLLPPPLVMLLLLLLLNSDNVVR